ncbi:MAG TPA: nicotinate-nucleotide adenylyltransferase [Candidatus Limiplasma sp.]|nr:nicotinate-nucleotide adenylyltransferase [Candidatus Limiplasma sp.]HRX07788.1 nicotinate-nucleotide adenylyltransferase [Candidatus Limiplasma sp.]
MARSRIGIMGGSFNPIHRRHLQIAERALLDMKLDQVLFIPNGNPPHKQQELADTQHRMEMTRLAVIPYQKFTATDIEITRTGVIYTVDTLRLLRKQYPEAEFICLIGEDAMGDLTGWYEPLELFSLCSFAVCKRTSEVLDDQPVVKKLRTLGAKLSFLSLEPKDISASDIRRRIQNGEDVQALLTPEVYEYIRLTGLYGCPVLPGADVQLYTRLRDMLSDDRLLHSMAVASTAHHLAVIYSLPADACELAGLLHDCAKCMDLGTLRQIAQEHKLKLSDTEMRSNGLLHGPVGAVIAKEQFGVRDPAVLGAISAHTTGYAGMEDFDMVVFLADKIEPYRNHIDGLDVIRTQAQKDLHGATYRMLLHSREYLLKTHRLLHPDTDKTIAWMRDRIHTKGENSVHDIQGNRNQGR